MEKDTEKPPANETYLSENSWTVLIGGLKKSTHPPMPATPEWKRMLGEIEGKPEPSPAKE